MKAKNCTPAFISALWLVLTACASAQQNQPTNTVELPYKAFLEPYETNQPLRINDPIWVKYSVSNLSDARVYLADLDGRREFKVSMQTDSGVKLKAIPNNTVDEGRRTSTEVKPGAGFTSKISLAVFCEIPGPGTYTATVGRRVYWAKGQSAVIESAPLVLKIEASKPETNAPALVPHR